MTDKPNPQSPDSKEPADTGENGSTPLPAKKTAKKKAAKKTAARKSSSAAATEKPGTKKAPVTKARAGKKSATKAGASKATSKKASSAAKQKTSPASSERQTLPPQGQEPPPQENGQSAADSPQTPSLAHHAKHPPAKDPEARPRKRADPAAAKRTPREARSTKSEKPGKAGGSKAKARKSASQLEVVETQAELRKCLAELRPSNATTLALVPTMGALHDGHLALVKQALEAADDVVVSIFVNPTQFAPHEDLETYPRDMDGDLAKLAALGVRLVWAPERATMYPDGFATRIRPAGVASGLEADARPHFFEGVATIVSKLFNQVRPDIAVFGEKDYQQLCVIRQLNRDLDFGIDIRSGPTIRENDGLALSSRNAYLDEAQRSIAPALHRVLKDVAAKAARGDDRARLKADAKIELLAAGFSKVDYLEVRDAETLADFDPASGRAGRVLAAAWLKSTRLIDNVPTGPEALST